MSGDTSRDWTAELDPDVGLSIGVDLSAFVGHEAAGIDLHALDGQGDDSSAIQDLFGAVFTHDPFSAVIHEAADLLHATDDLQDG